MGIITTRGIGFLCLTLTSCGVPADSPALPPSADSFRAGSFDVRIGAALEKVHGATVNSTFFREAKVLPLVGRSFLAEEYEAASPRVVMIAASFWKRRFGGDPAVIGTTLRINDQQYTIVGILPLNFQFPAGAEIWLPRRR